MYFAIYAHQLVTGLAPFVVVAHGTRRGPEQWLSMRPGVEMATMALEASAPLTELGYGDQLERNRLLLEHAARLVEDRAAGASDEAHRATARWPEHLARLKGEHACRRPPPGVPRLIWGDRSKELGHETHRGQLDFHLQHPAADRLQRIRPGIEERATLKLVDAWVDDLAGNYAELVAAIPADCADHADVDFEASADEDGPSPVDVRVGDRRKGEPAEVEPLATTRLVIEGGLQPQPDGIDLRPRDRWRIRGHRLQDGTIMPCWGTHRTVDSVRTRG